MVSRKDITAVCIPPSSSLKEALDIAARNDPEKSGIPAGIVLVVDERQKLLGIATSGDLLRAVAKGTPLSRPVTMAMNRDPFVVVGKMQAGEIIRQAIKETREKGRHKGRFDKVVVVDRQRRVIDLVDLYDIWQASDVRLRRVGIVGLGYVGLTLGITLADVGFKVYGFDTNAQVRKMVASKKPHFLEVGLPELMREHVGKKLFPVDSLKAHPCEAYIIAVGTPLSADKKPDFAYLRSAALTVGKVLKQGDVVILRSTVPMGTTRGIVVPVLEKASGLVAGDDFYVAFAPERTVEGRALEELRNLPQIIGGINRASANIAADIFNLMTRTIHVVDTLEEAEIVKLINNTYRDVTFAFANEVALICQKWGVDTNKVIEAANAGYPRSLVPKPSPGVGGYCLDKDPYIFIEGAREKNYEPALFHHARQVNVRILDEVGRHIIEHVQPRGKDAKIFILGFAFKGRPATSDLRGSTTLALLRKLQAAGFKNIHGFDAVVPGSELRHFKVKPSGVERGFAGADAVIIMNNHEAHDKLDIVRLLRKAKKGVLFYDTWALHHPAEVAKVAHVHHKRL
ncbi:MAG TPA: nucleotide sugar dehydrogenase [Candidatus Paceibacterota bacterium]